MVAQSHVEAVSQDYYFQQTTGSRLCAGILMDMCALLAYECGSVQSEIFNSDHEGLCQQKVIQ